MCIRVHGPEERLEVLDSLAGVTDGGEALMWELEVNLSPLEEQRVL